MVSDYVSTEMSFAYYNYNNKTNVNNPISHETDLSFLYFTFEMPAQTDGCTHTPVDSSLLILRSFYFQLADLASKVGITK